MAVITVNHNTCLLIAQLIYSLCARLGNQFSQLIVVDNASTDGSRELLERMSDSGLCELIANDKQLYHGPALNQAMNRLAERQTISNQEALIDYVWVLDSDCMVIRADTLSEATRTLQRTGAALAGQASANQWHAEETIGLYSLLSIPAACYRHHLVVTDWWLSATLFDAGDVEIQTPSDTRIIGSPGTASAGCSC